MNLADFITKFSSYLIAEKRVSHNTFLAYKQDLLQFQEFCDQKKISIDVITATTFQDFLASLKDRGISARSMARKIAALKSMFSYLAQRYERQDIAQDLIAPKIKKTLPDHLTIEEIELLFKAASKDSTLSGKRNSIMLYLMYATGVRVSELINLTMVQLHRDTATIVVDGKRGRQRLIPIPDSIMGEISYYVDQVRPQLLLKKGTSDYLFPICYGKKIKILTRQAFWGIVKNVCKTAGIAKPISPHTLRHSFATHMLNKGANLRSLQLLLGHEQLATVQIYTHVDTSRLREIYDKKHPRSR